MRINTPTKYILTFSIDNKKHVIVLDAIENDSISLRSQVTTYPIVSGEMVADHMYRDAARMTLSGSFSLTQGSDSLGVFISGKNKDGQYFNRLQEFSLEKFQAIFEEINANGILCQLTKATTTGDSSIAFKERKNMALTAITWTQAINSLAYSFEFLEILSVDTEDFSSNEKIAYSADGDQYIEQYLISSPTNSNIIASEQVAIWNFNFLKFNVKEKYGFTSYFKEKYPNYLKEDGHSIILPGDYYYFSNNLNLKFFKIKKLDDTQKKLVVEKWVECLQKLEKVLLDFLSNSKIYEFYLPSQRNIRIQNYHLEFDEFLFKDYAMYNPLDVSSYVDFRGQITQTNSDGQEESKSILSAFAFPYGFYDCTLDAAYFKRSVDNEYNVFLVQRAKHYGLTKKGKVFLLVDYCYLILTSYTPKFFQDSVLKILNEYLGK